MARNLQSALLDQLMGYDRDTSRKTEITWDDERICTSYLAGFCPHELFVNTRMSLGPCTKIHEENFLNKYKESSSYLKVGYENKLKRILQGFVKDVQSKIRSNEDKLQITSKPNLENIIENRIRVLEREIDELVMKIEEYGNEGRIEECQYLCAQLEEKQREFKYDKIELERQKDDTNVNQDVVCQICGAFTSKNDIKISAENHIGGKIHSGYEKINEVLEDLEKVLASDQSNDRRRNSPSNDRQRTKHSRTRDSGERSDSRRSNRSDYYRDESSRKHRREGKDNHKSRNRSRSRESSRSVRKGRY